MSEYPVQEVRCKVKHSLNCASGHQLPPFTPPPSGVDEHDGETKQDKKNKWKFEEGTGCYGVRVVNGKMEGAGVDNYSVFVNLVGTKGSTGKVHLHGITQCLVGGIKKNTHQDLIIKTWATLGDIQVVILGIDGKIGLHNTWFVQYTVVYDFFGGSGKEGVQFPCYHWIKPDQTVTTTAVTTTPQAVANNSILRHERDNQLAHRKLQYQWEFFPESGLPSGIDATVGDLPADEEFTRCKSIDFTKAGLCGIVATDLSGVNLSMNSLEDYLALSGHLEQHDLFVHVAGRWTSDVEFGRQILNAVNPVVIERCTCLPDNFPVTSAMVEPFLTRGLTLKQEMEAGHIYICNMKIMDGLPPRAGQYVPAPICLLYVNCAQKLVPIAIQLKQGLREEKKEEPNPIFLPSDGWIDWLLAKTYYQSAHGQFHELSTHYLSCHAAMEAYSMATMRNLPDTHPINKLLRPHFRFTMAINTRARATLINTGGIIDTAFGIGGAGKEELLKRATTIYSVDWTNIKKNVKERGVDNPDLLPGYCYRDDGLKIFEALEEFVRDVVNAFYACDKDVESDYEIQAWADDIHTNAFPGYFSGTKGHGFPSAIATKEELIERCTVIIFTGSAQHSSVNFGQYTYYGFVPNAPLSMRRPPPTEKGADYQTLLDSLPDKHTAKASMNITYALSQYSSDEVYLGDYPYMRFTEIEIQRYIKRLQKKLDGISGEIEVRNERLDVPYKYMLPKKVTNSITI